eukprot:2301096-Amphidinium_carterae.1
MLPESGILRKATKFCIYENRFAGTLPDGGLRVMKAVTYFSIEKNSFAGMLPASGILRKVTGFYIYENRFAGTLPHRGTRCLREVTWFIIRTNRFSGSLPDGGLRVMQAVTRLFINDNFFAGTVAESLPLPHESKPWHPPPNTRWRINSRSFPQNVASSPQSVKPRKHVGAWPQLL